MIEALCSVVIIVGCFALAYWFGSYEEPVATKKYKYKSPETFRTTTTITTNRPCKSEVTKSGTWVVTVEE